MVGRPDLVRCRSRPGGWRRRAGCEPYRSLSPRPDRVGLPRRASGKPHPTPTAVVAEPRIPCREWTRTHNRSRHKVTVRFNDLSERSARRSKWNDGDTNRSRLGEPSRHDRPLSETMASLCTGVSGRFLRKTHILQKMDNRRGWDAGSNVCTSTNDLGCYTLDA